MSRHDGDPVPHEHQFYRTVLKGLISLDLHAAGTFSYRNRTGYRNLDEIRRSMAEDDRLEHLPEEQSFRLPVEQRVERVSALLRGLALLSGGAKQALHYTDVTPAVVLAMVTRGGNNPLQYVINADAGGAPRVHSEALREMARVWGDQILSPLYVGWVQGFHDEQRDRLRGALDSLSGTDPATRVPLGGTLDHPREALAKLAEDVRANASTWLA
jgi:CRISPR-associated protein Cst2